MRRSSSFRRLLSTNTALRPHGEHHASGSGGRHQRRGQGAPSFGPALRQVQWLHKFKPEMPPRYDGAADPLAFLLAYEEVVLKARGDDKVMANWLPMALAGAPRDTSPTYL